MGRFLLVGKVPIGKHLPTIFAENVVGIRTGVHGIPEASVGFAVRSQAEAA